MQGGSNLAVPPLPPVTLIGFPFRATGRGEHIRSIWRALAAAGIVAGIHNIDGPGENDSSFAAFEPNLVDGLAPGIRLFHLNGDEVDAALATIEQRQPGAFRDGNNIVFPAWELPRYPAAWARSLERFDEVWTASAFVENSVAAAVSVPVLRIPNACEPHLETPLGREHFGLPGGYLVLFVFDAWSYPARKNPFAAVETFRQVLLLRPQSGIHLVLKLSHSEHVPGLVDSLRQAVSGIAEHVTIIDATVALDEARSLACDCFLSLHRSEGFGRGPAEAMFFGKPVVATGWSGNMEYMNAGVSFPVGYQLIPVAEGDYPEWQEQVWAEPDIAAAAAAMLTLIDDPALREEIGARARAHMQENFSDLVLGARYRDRFIAILEQGNLAAQALAPDLPLPNA